MERTNVEVALAWAEAIQRGDLSDHLWSEDLEIVNAEGWVLESVYRGHEGLHRWWHDLSEAFSEFTMVVEDVEPIDDERLLTSQRFVGTFRETGISFDGPWASVLTIRDGRIVHAIGYLTKERALRALSDDA